MSAEKPPAGADHSPAGEGKPIDRKALYAAEKKLTRAEKRQRDRRKGYTELVLCDICKKPGTFVFTSKGKNGKTQHIRFASPMRRLFPTNKKSPFAHEFCMRRKRYL